MKKVLPYALLTFFLLLSYTNMVGQTIKYQMPGGELLSPYGYEDLAKSLKSDGVKTVIVDSLVTANSITRVVEYRTETSNPNSDEQQILQNFSNKKSDLDYLLNTHFPIQDFKDENGQNFSKDYLRGKVTFINLWFINCPPCKKEIPVLNQLQSQLKNEVDFLAITFDKKEEVDAFTKDTPYHFKHITEAGRTLYDLGVQMFPTSLIIDKEGIVQKIYFPDIKESDLKEITSFVKQL